MTRKITNCNLIAVTLVWVVAMGFMTQAIAATVTYNGDDRPIEFLGLNVDGTVFDVTVTWDGTFEDTYGGGTDPVDTDFMGDTSGATLTVEAMRDALQADGYSFIPLTSYLWVPSSYTTHYNGPAYYLQAGGLEGIINNVGVETGTEYGSVGYTQFATVPVPAAVWLLGSALGILGWMRRRPIQ